MGQRFPARAPALAALVILGAAAVTRAADGSDGESRPVLYETATVFARPLEQATGSVTVLDRHEIEQLHVVTVAELLRHVPGVDVTSNGARGGTATAQLRGGDPNFTLVLIDGVPLNDGTDTFGGSVNLNSLPVAHVERVEVVRGPLSSFYGSTGLGGAVNLITRRSGSATPSGDAEIEAGNASLLRAAASLAAQGPRARYFVGASWQREDGRIADDAFEQVHVQGNLQLQSAGAGELRLTGRLASWDVIDYAEGSGGPRGGSGETRRSEHVEHGLGADWSFGAQPRRQRVHARIYRHELDRETPAILPVVPASRERTRFTRAQAGWSVPALAAAHLRLSVGIAVDWERGSNDSVLFAPPPFGGPVDGAYRIERTTAGAFLDVVGERGRWLYELGARLDLPDDFDSQISPRAGMAYRFRDDSTRLRCSLGRAFKLPSFFALASPSLLGGNPDLEPEVALGADVAVEHRVGENGPRLTLTLFRNEFEELIDFDFATFAFVNRAEVRARGAELALSWKLRDVLEVHAQVTRQDVEDRETSRTLRNRPDWVGAARLAWTPTERWRWEVDLQSVSERFDEQIPVPQRDTVAGYGVWGTAASFRASHAWQLRARVDNLTDKSHETLIGFPGPGRSLRVTLRYGAP